MVGGRQVTGSFIQSYKQGVELRTTETKSSEKQSEGPGFRTSRLEFDVQFFITNFKQGKHWAVSVGKWNNCLVAGISNMVIKIVEYIAITNFGKGMFRASIKYQIFQICWSCFPPYFVLWLITNQCFQTTFICKIHRHILLLQSVYLIFKIGPWACFYLNQWTK